MAIPYDPSYRGSVSLARELELDRDLQHDASASAAIVAVELISSARLALKLDSVYTEYSAQYLVDRACPGTKLTVKDCLEFALKEGGIPKVDGWLPLGTKIKLPSSCTPALVSMKGQVVEAKDIKEASDLLMDQPVAAKLHVFSPQIEVGDGIYCGTSGEATCYVGLRDVIIVGVEKIQGKDIATVKLWYKNRFRFVKVALSRWFTMAAMGTHSNDSRNIETTFLLVDYCAPRLSV